VAILVISILDTEAQVDYHYGSALDSFRVHPRDVSAIRSALVRGYSPMNSLGLRSDSMLDCLERLDTVPNPTAVTASSEGWLDSPPPLFGRHPDEEGDLDEEAFDDDEDLDDDEDFDDENEEFDDEDFDDEDEDDIDEELDDEIDDIDIDEEDEDFDDDEDLDELDDEEEDEDLDDI
jgi:hypothetical protein